jgi:glycosyltransferase involved in cell wall biosynthesis
MIRFSIITIVRNDIVGVIRTLQSIFAQTYENVEIIVQDGASTDGTSEVLRGFDGLIDNLVIEPDDGIYDAMNRALRRASGDYCIFMNAADFFVGPTILEQVAKLIDLEKDDVWAGQSISDERGITHKYRPPDQFWAGSTFDHQSAFIRTNLLKQLEHDTQYKICADLQFFTRARQIGARFKYNDLVVARKPFAVGASSDFVDRLQDRLQMLEDAWGNIHPVRMQITAELKSNTANIFDLKKDLIATMSLENLLAVRERWISIL